MPTDDDSVKKANLAWWRNPREKLQGGLTLTDEGLDFLIGTLKLRSYDISFPKDFEFTTQVILFLDQYLDCPNYYTKKKIVVFNEKKACELMLFSGDVRKYGLAKAMSRQELLAK
jgi:hypothetical protein